MTRLEPGIIARIATGDVDACRIAADWLLERGEVRGEAILAALDERVNPATREAARRRRIALEIEHLFAWTAPLRELGVTDCGLRRGFVDWVALPERALSALPALLDLEPITALRVLVHDGSALRAAMRTSAFARIRTLQVNGAAVSFDVAAPALTTLVARPMTAARVAALPALFPVLESLAVSSTEAGDAALTALGARALTVKQLRAVHAGVTDRALLTLVERGSEVEALDLSFNDLTPRALKQLGDAQSLSALRELGLRGYHGLTGFLSPVGLPALRRLRLRRPPTTDRALFAARGISLW